MDWFNAVLCLVVVVIRCAFGLGVWLIVYG